MALRGAQRRLEAVRHDDSAGRTSRRLRRPADAQETPDPDQVARIARGAARIPQHAEAEAHEQYDQAALPSDISSSLRALAAQGRGIPHGHVLELGALDGRSEEHTSEIQSLMRNSYAVFCL